jgi:branched-chain amino acid aminotransferase
VHAASSVQQFVDAVKQTILANKRWVSSLSGNSGYSFSANPSTDAHGLLFIKYLYFQVPPTGKGSLYIRPLLMGSGSVLDLAFLHLHLLLSMHHL